MPTGVLVLLQLINVSHFCLVCKEEVMNKVDSLLHDFDQAACSRPTAARRGIHFCGLWLVSLICSDPQKLQVFAFIPIPPSINPLPAPSTRIQQAICSSLIFNWMSDLNKNRGRQSDPIQCGWSINLHPWGFSSSQHWDGIFLCSSWVLNYLKWSKPCVVLNQPFW